MSRWTSKLNTDEDLENDAIFDGEESIFQDEGKINQHNPNISHAEEGLPGVPLEQQAAYLAKNNLRRTLVAVDSPNGVLVAKALRNTTNGHVKHLERFRKPTQKELIDIQKRGIKVTNNPQTIEQHTPGSGSLLKSLLWLGGIGAIAGGGWWAYKRFGSDDVDEED